MDSSVSVLSGKQKRFLRGLGNRLEAGIVVGHGGLSENCYKNLDLCLKKNELVKVRFQPAAGIDAKEGALELCEKSGSQLVQVFGRTVLIYRKNLENSSIKLP